jgi:hypothetical protein
LKGRERTDAYAGQIAAMRITLDAERQASVARIGELEATLQAERDAFIARISELERAMKRFAKLATFARWVYKPACLEGLHGRFCRHVNL